MWQLALTLTLLMSFPAFAGEPLSLYDGQVAFVLPEGFTRMTDEMADKKYPRGNRPKYIYADAKTTTSVAVELAKDAQVAPEQLGDFRAFMENTFSRMVPGARWLKKDYLTIANTKWARLELMGNAIDTEIHNIVLITVLDKKPLIFNFNSTQEEFPKLEKELLKSIGSIRVSVK